MLKRRSECPINLAVEVLGDKWTLIVLRDIVFADRRSFRELLDESEEGIASNILAARLRHLTDIGLLVRESGFYHRQKVRYRLTEPAIELVPVLAALDIWGAHYFSLSRSLSARAEVLEQGGSEVCQALMAELQERHIGHPQRPAGEESILNRLREACEPAKEECRSPVA
jgi:DNA-binding HxlR family transcriptional regulator